MGLSMQITKELSLDGLKHVATHMFPGTLSHDQDEYFILNPRYKGLFRRRDNDLYITVSIADNEARIRTHIKCVGEAYELGRAYAFKGVTSQISVDKTDLLDVRMIPVTRD